MTDFRGEYETPEDDVRQGGCVAFLVHEFDPNKEKFIPSSELPDGFRIEFCYAAMERMTNPVAHELRLEISRLTNSLIASNSVIAVLCRRAGGRLEITDDEFRELRKNKAPKSHNDPVTGNLIVEIEL